MRLLLCMRLLCLSCQHTERLRLNPLAMRSDWMRCSRCGADRYVRSHVQNPGRAARTRDFERGGTIIRVT